MRILQLPAAVANQIAAGEVIERPASIVKELLENSLDAKATTITIEIGYGGLNQIKISDNGIGIFAEDLPLAIAAHATSKITTLNDLYAISSMGFRGEALASIASIARLSISSKPAEQEIGMILCSHDVSPYPRSQGTTIDVRDIFYNAPVRKKFLKSERSEFQAIEGLVKRFALSAPSMAITLHHNGKLHLQLPAALTEHSQLARIVKLLGKAFVAQSTYLDVTHADIRLYGWVSGADYQRSQNDKLWVYINGRMVKDKLINHAIKQAYEGLLHPGRHPACLLYIVIPPDLVDINVHPTKHEVRFQQPRLIHDFISSQLQKIVSPIVAIPEKAIPSFSAFKKTTLQVRENHPVYHYKNLEAEPRGEVFKWMVLNQQFVLVQLQPHPYLVDVLALQRQWFLNELTQSPLPLAQRTLLVPITVENISACPLNNELLINIGIHVERLTESLIAIRSLPTLLPHLNIKSFMTAFLTSTDSLALTDLFELFVNHQTILTHQITHDEYHTYFTYLKSVMTLQEDHSFARHLCEKTCRDML
jgi:DNA mismatch repair protein MutL